MSGDCVISGSSVHGSLIFSRCRVHSYSQVNDSVVLPDCDISERCRITRAIIDRGCKISAGTVIGENKEEDRQRGFRVTEKKITLVTPDMLGQKMHFTR